MVRTFGSLPANTDKVRVPVSGFKTEIVLPVAAPAALGTDR